MSLDLPRYGRSVEEFTVLLKKVPEKLTAVQLAADRWSLREILGHLVDSASNNHQRFVRLQDQDHLQFPAYKAERWVEIQRVNEMPWPTLVALWQSYNALLLHLASGVRPGCLGNTWDTAEGPRSLEFLIGDYYRHLAEHAEHFRGRLAEVQAAAPTGPEPKERRSSR
jgi:hypothetical protein